MTDSNERTPLLVQQTERNDRMATNNTTSTTYWRVGAFYGAAAVCLGAFGAHGLKKHITDPAKIASWSTAAHYQVYIYMIYITYRFISNLPFSFSLLLLTYLPQHHSSSTPSLSSSLATTLSPQVYSPLE